MSTILDALREFAETLTANFAAAPFNPAQAEDQLKGPTQRLLKQVGEAAGLDVVARTEALTDLGVRPDLGVSIGRLLAGHVELKAPGKGARARSFTGHDREQFNALSDHPNLLYSDGTEWALYRHGELVGQVVRFEGDVTADGQDAVHEASALALEALFRDFLGWEPIVPSSPRALAELLAPLTRLLRENVRTALTDETSALHRLADEWRNVFFPDADDAQFADAYAQTLTYALLLARVEGETDLHARAAERLDERHGLLAQVLRILTDPAARREVEMPVRLLERSIAAVDPEALARHAGGRDLWLYFYEDFLAAYDPKLRKQRGVYFTPPAVVEAQVTLVAELLRERFGKPLGFAGDDVVVLDPAVGTATYLLAALRSGIEAVRDAFGAGAVPARVSVMAESFNGFEILIGSYAVAHLRLAQQILEAGGDLPAEGAHIYLTDTLESPHLAPPGLAVAPLFQQKLAEENERARRVKAEVPVLVCIGNPPYFRQVIEQDEEGVERQGGWIRFGDRGDDGILADFLRDTPPVHAKNLYNLYVYFWRWALWKVFGNAPARGVVSFITPSSYLRGPGFAGMRRFMRETFDDLWILDLGGDNLGARRSENVFDIQNPVAIAVGVRDAEPDPGTPARIRYAQIDGTREEKLAALDAIAGFGSIHWRDCFGGWFEPFLPAGEGDYYSWPPVTDVFPWQHSGVQFKRTWPIAPDRATLEARWRRLVSAPEAERAGLFRQTPDRSSTGAYGSIRSEEQPLPSLDSLGGDAPAPASVGYAYRTLDRQFCLADNRLGDRMRPPLWRTASARQLFLTSLLTNVLGQGPAATVTHLVPDLHHFRGSFGGKNAVPLWRDAACTEPNVTAGLLDVLAGVLGREVTPEDLLAYVYAILQAPVYTARFAEELGIPGPRVPLTRDPALFREAVDLGERLIWLHTFGERLVPDRSDPGVVPAGRARCTEPVGTTPETYPTEFSWNEERQELHVGDGVFAPVPAAVWGFSVSGFEVLTSWLRYRMRDGGGKRSSPLDEIRPTVWPAAFTEELLRVIWILEHTVELQPALDELLGRIVEGPTIPEADLPTPTETERKAPTE
ncbi:MAG: type ISP restriction/modification enzyme [Gaiellales bacterium]